MLLNNVVISGWIVVITKNNQWLTTLAVVQKTLAMWGSLSSLSAERAASAL